MEAASLTTSPSADAALSRRTPLVRFQTDERLIALMREGHERAFEFLVRRYQGRLLAFCRRLLGSPQDAEDVLQEVFAAAHAAILADSRPINARPWLYRIATNTALDSLRRRKRITWVPFKIEMEPVAPQSDYAPRHADQDAIQHALQAVPADQRTCLVLNMYQGLSYKEIAETLGISVNLVAVRIFRGREKFVDAYKKANPAE